MEYVVLLFKELKENLNSYFHSCISSLLPNTIFYGPPCLHLEDTALLTSGVFGLLTFAHSSPKHSSANSSVKRKTLSVTENESRI